MNGGKRAVVRDLGLEWLRGASAIWSGLLRRSDADPVFMNDNHHRALGVRRRV
jgi:hypothetical protein